jgi:hypothetical protein
MFVSQSTGCCNFTYHKLHQIQVVVLLPLPSSARFALEIGHCRGFLFAATLEFVLQVLATVVPAEQQIYTDCPTWGHQAALTVIEKYH